eukprot:4935471-Amphidinium_carterae.1
MQQSGASTTTTTPTATRHLFCQAIRSECTKENQKWFVLFECPALSSFLAVLDGPHRTTDNQRPKLHLPFTTSIPPRYIPKMRQC